MQYKINPLVSIITASLNNHRELIRTYKSIKKSNYQQIEWIIVDACSTDGTLNFLKNNSFPKWIYEKDTGIYSAWNKGVKLAQGDWIIFLGCGDILNPNWIEDAIKKSTTIKNLQIIYGDVYLINEKYMNISKKKGLPWAIASNQLKFSMCLPHPGMLQHRSLFKENSFDESLKIIADWKFLLESKPKNVIYMSDSIMANVLIGGISASFKSIDIHYSEYSLLIKSGLAKTSIVHFLKWKFKILFSNSGIIFTFLQKLWHRI